MRIVRLWPFSLGERMAGTDGFVDRAFEGPETLLAHQGQTFDRDDYLIRACEGGFPGVQGLEQRDRDHWFADYLDTVIQREIATAGDIRNVSGLRRLALYLAAHSSQELVIAKVTSDLGLDRATVESYIAWLETAFLVHRVPAWGRNLSAKVVRRSKVFATDSGICASMLGKTPSSLRAMTEPATGPVVETLVIGELAKQSTWSDISFELAHMRDATGREVDAILEARDGRVVGIEVKCSNTPKLEDFRWLRDLRDRMDAKHGRFVAGVVLHTGRDRLPFGDRLVALPIGDLWT
jgi:predicted AAA+ superfamily ATPase